AADRRRRPDDASGEGGGFRRQAQPVPHGPTAQVRAHDDDRGPRRDACRASPDGLICPLSGRRTKKQQSPGRPAHPRSGRRPQGPIKVGVLHSLSGTMAISETTLKDTVLMMVDDLNKKGGLLGKKVEAVVVDPASNWPLFAEKARELIAKDKVDVVFGCWTSVSRKSVLPVFEELNGLLFYPVQYEGEESSKNVFYTGAAPNQQAIPAVDYLMK